jgi:hypothetical protein
LAIGFWLLAFGFWLLAFDWITVEDFQSSKSVVIALNHNFLNTFLQS